MHKLDGKTVITIIGVISLMVFTFIFTVGYILGNLDPENKLEGYTIAVSFIGIFATFGGAYLGAKIAGDNARKLYEYQKNQEDNEKISKVELLANIKIIEVLNHSKILENVVEILYVAKNDKREFNEIKANGVINFDEVIDGYAKPIIELLEDREIYNGTSELYKSLIKMFNECNRMKQHIELVDINIKGHGHPVDRLNLHKKEIKMIEDIYFENRGLVRGDIISRFVEYQFIKKILDECIQEVLRNIAEDNRLVDFIKFHKYNSLGYIIKL